MACAFENIDDSLLTELKSIIKKCGLFFLYMVCLAKFDY